MTAKYLFPCALTLLHAWRYVCLCVLVSLCLLLLPRAALAATPVAQDISAKVIKDTQHSTLNSLNLQASDSDGDVLSYRILSLPTHGKLEGKITKQEIATVPCVLSSNKLKYIPDSSFQGQDSFTYQASDASSSSETATVSLNIVEWFPPIGIPDPEFGIKESYRMYDDPAKRSPALTYTQNAEGGFYTHYVNFNTGNDTNNPYGTLAWPRKTIPAMIPAGSVVEAHGQISLISAFSSQGTASLPVFVRGITGDEPLFTNSVRPAGSYMIIENLHVNNASIQFHYNLSPPRDHVAIRGCELWGLAGGKITVGDYRFTDYASYIVFYNNYVHDTGDIYNHLDLGDCSFYVGSYSRHVWVVDNHSHNAGQDSFQMGHGDSGDRIARYVYVGRNEFHHDRENGIDIKGAYDLIVSENRIYGYHHSAFSNGDALRVNDEYDKNNIWLLFNEVYDSELGIVPLSSPFRPYIIGNVVYDCPVYGIWDNKKTGVAEIGSIAVHNTIYNVGIGIEKVKEANSNIISYTTTPIIPGYDGVVTNNVLDIPLANMPLDSSRTSWWQYPNSGALITNTGSATTVTVVGENFEVMGVELNDRISVPWVDGIKRNADTCPAGLNHVSSASYQRVRSVSGDTITLKYDALLCPGVTTMANAPITVYYYPPIANEFYLEPGWEVTVGDHLEYDYDGVVRTVTAVYRNGATDPAGTIKDRIVFDPPVASGIQGDRAVSNWGSRTNFTRDFSLPSDSPAIDAGLPHPIYSTFQSLYGIDIEKDSAGNMRPAADVWDAGAYEYASEATGFIYGDVSGDGDIGAYDAALTAQTAVGSITLTAEQTQKADVSGEGEVGAYDAALIAQRAVGLILKFPVEG